MINKDYKKKYHIRMNGEKIDWINAFEYHNDPDLVPVLNRYFLTDSFLYAIRESLLMIDQYLKNSKIEIHNIHIDDYPKENKKLITYLDMEYRPQCSFTLEEMQ